MSEMMQILSDVAGTVSGAGLVAISQSVKNGSLVLGLGSLAGGIFSLYAHKHRYDEVCNSPSMHRELAFETRKYRRRAIASSLIASTGIMLAGIYGVEEPRTIAIFVAVILLMLVGITGLAFFDLFSVGIQEIARTDEPARQALVEEYQRQRQKLAESKRNADGESDSNNG